MKTKRALYILSGVSLLTVLALSPNPPKDGLGDSP